MEFAPIIEFNNKRLILKNFLAVRDANGKAVAVAKNGFEIEFVEDDAAKIFEELEKILEIADRLQLPLVGLENQILILMNFTLVEDMSDDEQNKVVLTSDDGDEMTFTGADAALILARMDTVTVGTQQLLNRLAASANN